MFDRQCVNITILDDDLRETPFNSFPQSEVFGVLLRFTEPNADAQLGVQTAFVSIVDDDCKLSVYNAQLLLEYLSPYPCPIRILLFPGIMIGLFSFPVWERK